jgi:hypothetical protein
MGLACNRQLSVGGRIPAESRFVYCGERCRHPRHVFCVSTLVASVDPNIAAGTIQAIAGVIVAVIGGVAAWASSRYAARQKANETKTLLNQKIVADEQDLRRRADDAEIKAREQLWSSVLGELQRVHAECEDMRKRLRSSEEEHEKERAKLWSYARQQEAAIKNCEERCAGQSIEIAKLNVTLSQYVTDVANGC